MADDYYAAVNSMFEVGSMEFFRLALMVRLMPSMINDLLYCCCDPATLEIDFYFLVNGSLGPTMDFWLNSFLIGTV